VANRTADYQAPSFSPRSSLESSTVEGYEVVCCSGNAKCVSIFARRKIGVTWLLAVACVCVCESEKKGIVLVQFAI